MRNKLKNKFKVFYTNKTKINYPKHLSIEDLLIALSCLGSHYPHSRFRLIFCFYDINRDGYLSEDELREMVRNIHNKLIEEIISITSKEEEINR